MYNEQLAVLLIIIIFLLGIVLFWIKITASNQIRHTSELINDLEVTLKNEISKRLDKEEHI